MPQEQLSEEDESVTSLRQLKGRSGVKFKTYPYMARYITVKLPAGLYAQVRGSDLTPFGGTTKTVAMALGGCSMAQVRRGDIVFLDDDEHINVIP